MGVVRNLRYVTEDDNGIDIAFRTDVATGLAQSQKAIPARWLYDSAGSVLFESITALPEYYITRSESVLLKRHAAAIAEAVGTGRAVVEFGAGSVSKTPLLLRAIAPAAYVAVDIAGDFLRTSTARLVEDFSRLSVYPLEADFTQPLTLPSDVAPMAKLGFFTGSTIGNFAADTAISLLLRWRHLLGADSLLLIGIDRIKNIEVLQRAYDDSVGVTAAFNMNLLSRINRELEGTIPLDNFVHHARWNNIEARIEMHLEAQRDMEFSVAGDLVRMGAGETIHSENSHKYGPRDASLLLRAGGWTPLAVWEDVEPSFALIVARASSFPTAP